MVVKLKTYLVHHCTCMLVTTHLSFVLSRSPPSLSAKHAVAVISAWSATFLRAWYTVALKLRSFWINFNNIKEVWEACAAFCVGIRTRMTVKFYKEHYNMIVEYNEATCMYLHDCSSLTWHLLLYVMPHVYKQLMVVHIFLMPLLMI